MKNLIINALAKTLEFLLTPIVIFVATLWVLFTKEGEEYINNYQNNDVNGADFCF